MKKYCNWVDCTVFISLIGSIIWLSFYKLIWLDDTELLFPNADKWADTTYTVITSIVASAFFYIVTVFLLKIKRILEMKKRLPFYLDFIDNNLQFIVSQVKDSETCLAYTYDKFMSLYANEIMQLKMKKEFADTWGKNEETFNLLKNYILLNNTYLNSITLNYSDLFTSNLLIELRDNSNIYSDSLNLLPQRTLSKASAEHSLFIILQLYGIINRIRTTYNIYQKESKTDKSKRKE